MSKRKVGRPTLASLGLPRRERHNFNMERDEQFDFDLMKARINMAKALKVPYEQISQTDVVKKAVKLLAELGMKS